MRPEDVPLEQRTWGWWAGVTAVTAVTAVMTQAEFEARQVMLEANWAAIRARIALIERSKWRVFRNQRLIRECRALLAENRDLLQRFWQAP